MRKLTSICLLIVLLTSSIASSGTHDPWDGSLWDVASPDIDQSIGDSYKEIFDLRKGVAIRINKEHETLATSSAGGVHKQGSARAFFQDAAPTTQIDTTAWDAGDTGSLWFDTNATPDNLFYVLTDHASTGTWTLVSTSIEAELVAAVHQWADVQTFDVAAIFTTGLTANDDIILGAGDDLVGSATSSILFNTNKFTVAGATGNTLVAGTLDVTGTLDVVGNLDPTTFETTNGGFIDEDSMATDSAVKAPSQQSVKAYVDAQVAVGFGTLTGNDSEVNNFLVDHAYLVQQDGIVTAIADLTQAETMTGFNGATDDPAGAGNTMALVETPSLSATAFSSITFSVANGRYFEIVTSGAATASILWQPTQATGGDPIDQD